MTLPLSADGFRVREYQGRVGPVALPLSALFLSLLLIACASSTPEPAPDIPATVTAQVQEQLAAVPTATPLPTHTPYPTATP